MFMKPVFPLDLKDLKDTFNSRCRQRFPDLWVKTFSLLRFKVLKNRSGVPPPGNRTEGSAIFWLVKRRDIFWCSVQVVYAGICLKTGFMVQKSACR